MYSHPVLTTQHVRALALAYFVSVTAIRTALQEASCLSALGVCSPAGRVAWVRQACRVQVAVSSTTATN